MLRRRLDRVASIFPYSFIPFMRAFVRIMPDDSKYHDEKSPLASEDVSNDGGSDDGLHAAGFPVPSRSSSRTVPRWTLILSCFVTLVAICTTVATLVHTVGSAGKQQFDFSGYACAPFEADPAEARARGCFFDPFMMQWYPRERYERPETLELMNKFMDMGWPRHFDQEQKHPVEDLERAPMFIYILSKEHIWHCGYALLQTHLWMQMGFDPPMAYGHTVHCVETMLDLIEQNPPPDLYDVKRNGRYSEIPDEYQIVRCLSLPCHAFYSTLVNE